MRRAAHPVMRALRPPATAGQLRRPSSSPRLASVKDMDDDDDVNDDGGVGELANAGELANSVSDKSALKGKSALNRRRAHSPTCVSKSAPKRVL